MEFKFTPRTIKEIEDVAGKGYQEVLAEYSMGNVALFVRKGLNVDDDKAYSEIEEYLKDEKNSLPGLFLEIAEVLKEKGFLPRQGMGEEQMKKAKEALEGKK